MIPSLIIIATSLALMSILSRWPRTAILLPQVKTTQRIQTIDGLRGFLAAYVVFSHALSLRQYLRYGVWKWPLGYRFFQNSAEISVALFFCITGYLFWRKALSSSRKIDILSLYSRRIWRIYPLYISVVTITIFSCATLEHVYTFKAIFWGACSLALPGFKRWIVIGHTNTGLYLTQTWTLFYEVAFCMALPLMARAAKDSRAFSAFLIISSIAICCLNFAGLQFNHLSQLTGLAQITYPFVVGIAAAQYQSVHPYVNLESYTGVVLILIGLIGSFVIPSASSLVNLPFLCLIFITIAYGNSFMGLLTLRPSLILGEVSFSIYMIHLLLLNLAVRVLNDLVRSLTSAHYWIFTGALYLIICIAAMIFYRFLERPFMNGNPWRPSHKLKERI